MIQSKSVSAFFAAVILATAFAAYFTHVNKPRIVLAEDDQLEISASLAPRFEAVLPGFIDFIDDRFDELATQTDSEIEAGVDALFEPVYAAVPSYLDAHYTLRGQYGELAAAALANFSEESETLFRTYLFEKTGFDETQAAFLDGLSQSNEERLTAMFSRIENKLQADLDLRMNEQSTLRRGVALTINDAQDRLGDTLIIRGVAVAAGGALIMRVMSRKVVQRALVRGAGKAGSGALGGAVSGATTGAVCGPWCAFIGGVAGWVVTDLAIVKADELLNRDDFEAEIVHLIKEQHSTMKLNLRTSYRTMYREIETLNTSRLQNVRVRDQIGGSAAPATDLAPDEEVSM